jgi:hypothetical protein
MFSSSRIVGIVLNRPTYFFDTPKNGWDRGYKTGIPFHFVSPKMDGIDLIGLPYFFGTPKNGWD